MAESLLVVMDALKDATKMNLDWFKASRPLICSRR
jgi:hypothetical protein